MHITPELRNTTFVPDASNQRQLRDALGRFGTGVTIVTTATPEGPAAITVNSFSSVSLEPPLVLWSIDRNSSRYHTFGQSTAYSIHVLSTSQESLCMEVARDPFRLHNVDMQTNAFGVPVLDDCLARYDCTREALYEAGDHFIIVGRVQQATLMEDCEPLAFYRGRTGTFASVCDKAS